MAISKIVSLPSLGKTDEKWHSPAFPPLWCEGRLWPPKFCPIRKVSFINESWGWKYPISEEIRGKLNFCEHLYFLSAICRALSVGKLLLLSHSPTFLAHPRRHFCDPPYPCLYLLLLLCICITGERDVSQTYFTARAILLCDHPNGLHYGSLSCSSICPVRSVEKQKSM